MTVEVDAFAAKIAVAFMSDNWSQFVAHIGELADADGVDREEFAERVVIELGGDV